MFGIAMFLMKDWRHTPGTGEVLPYLDKVCHVHLLSRSTRKADVFHSTSLPMASSLEATAPQSKLGKLSLASSSCWDEDLVFLRVVIAVTHWYGNPCLG